MNIPAAWENRDAVIEHLAEQLNRGRLALFLGAGVSQNLGIPNWADLVTSVLVDKGEPPPATGDDLMAIMEDFQAKHFATDKVGYLNAVRVELYRKCSLGFASLRKNAVLSAIAALVMASSRGSASTVLTLNFDDILETYLEYNGFVTRSISEDFFWAGNSDVTIYHPHGFLPYGAGRSMSNDITFDQESFLKQIGRVDSPWHVVFQHTMRTHTCLYIGISGADLNLQSHLAQALDGHAINGDRIAYAGVRFALQGNDRMTRVMKNRKVYTQIVKDYDNDLPDFLFSICQVAARNRSAF